ncbi:hypothetical protein AU381_00175 [Sinorhizobium glycinis]|uniref:Uncharacterized protein n=1 Tax=Sinorhizobium glycinis TaxID=1472378 RepID=A0A178XYI3_9HYPH|nr:hypothetical protein [Sinorhizobium glycinis]OAP40379.1 hypothetical protein AU381_00175 [Sinorhizobium glycinis]
MAYAQSTLGYSGEAEPTRLPNNLQIASEALEGAKSLSLRVQAYVSRLCGDVPVNASTGKQAPQVEGLFGALGSASRDACSYIRDAHDALDRLERELP